MSFRHNQLFLQLTETSVSNGIFTSKIPDQGDLELDGSLVVDGVATFAQARRFQLITTEDESNSTVVISGKNRFGVAITETVTGEDLNATIYSSKLDFGEVGNVNIIGTFTGTLTIGTNGKASSEWFQLFNRISPFNIGITIKKTGGGSYFIDVTGDTDMTETNQEHRNITHNDFGSAKSINFSTRQEIPVAGLRIRYESNISVSDKLEVDFIKPYNS
jgi:hypothetical protein